MNTGSFHFKVGRFDCIAISDGSMPSHDAAQILFTNAPKRLLASTLREYNSSLDQWTEQFTCLVVKTEEHCVLFDTGLGVIDSVPSAGKLLQNLQACDIEPGEIDTVIISHAHGDHIGGNTDSGGQAVYPQARYYMRREEWDFWTSETTLANPAYGWMTEFVNQGLLPIRDRIQLLEQDLEIVPGITTLFAPGHTPGNLAAVIESGNEQLLYLGDVILHPIHVEHADWYSSFDCLPVMAVRTRQLLLERAVADQALIIAYHLDFPGLGYARGQQGKWKWQPIDMMD
ncbi:MAG: hypothetical protein A2Y88_01405 [Chloroflexi bacterium RBG_13_48_10]|nr:MAG: hypothetical protein A2Y88_01405 [Chloroflexi bacterium RBG_13_48_10]